ncbi:MAG: ankyrin repeat domain-containing protein, partial [Chrysiogenales bacterium]
MHFKMKYRSASILFCIMLLLLSCSALNGQEKVAEILIAKGADVNARNVKKRTPLHNAAGMGHKAVVKSLLTKGAEVNAQDDSGLTPLHTAALDGWRE